MKRCMIVAWVLTVCWASGVSGADRFWVGSGGLWSATDNWSAASGGASGAL